MNKEKIYPIPQVDKNSEELQVTINLVKTIDTLVHKLYQKPPAPAINNINSTGFHTIY